MNDFEKLKDKVAIEIFGEECSGFNSISDSAKVQVLECIISEERNRIYEKVKRDFSPFPVGYYPQHMKEANELIAFFQFVDKEYKP